MDPQTKGEPKSPAWAALEEAKLRRHPLVGELAKEVGEEAAANLVRGALDEPYLHAALALFKQGQPLAAALARSLTASCEEARALREAIVAVKYGEAPAAVMVCPHCRLTPTPTTEGSDG